MTQFIGYCSFNLKRFSYHCHSYFFKSKTSKFLQSTLFKCCHLMSTFKKNATPHSKYYCGARKHSTFLIAIMLTMTALYLVSLIGPIISRPLHVTSVKIQTKIPVYSILGYQTFHKNVIQSPFKSNNHKSMKNGNNKLKSKSNYKAPSLVVGNNPWWLSSHLLDKLMGKSKLKEDLSYSVPANKLPIAQKSVNGLSRSLASFPWLNETAPDIYEQCRNSVQGPQFVTDERGYVCHRVHLLPNGCCDINRPRPDNFLSPHPSYNDEVGETYVPEYVGDDTKSDLAITPPNVYDDITSHGVENVTTRSNRDTVRALSNASFLQSNNGSFAVLDPAGSTTESKGELARKDSTLGEVSGGVGGRYVCVTCGPDFCCAVYEHCVSCCLDPDRRPTIQAVMARWGRGRDRALTAARDHFEACLARCRTWSGSVQHENAYRSPRAKHCFGTAMAPIDTVEAVVPNHVGPVNK